MLGLLNSIFPNSASTSNGFLYENKQVSLVSTEFELEGTILYIFYNIFNRAFYYA